MRALKQRELASSTNGKVSFSRMFPVWLKLPSKGPLAELISPSVQVLRLKTSKLKTRRINQLTISRQK